AMTIQLRQPLAPPLSMALERSAAVSSSTSRSALQARDAFELPTRCGCGPKAQTKLTADGRGWTQMVCGRPAGTLQGPGKANGSSIDATVEPGEPRHFGTGAASIWYRWTATNNGLATFDTIGSDFDTVLVAYAGTNFASLTKLAGNDDVDSQFFTSRITFSTV